MQENNGIVLTGREAFEVFAKWGGGENMFRAMATSMVSLIGVEGTVQLIRDGYLKKGHSDSKDFFDSLRNAILYITDNTEKN